MACKIALFSYSLQAKGRGCNEQVNFITYGVQLLSFFD